MAHASHLDVLVAMGLDMGTGNAKMKEWNVAGKSITLRFSSKEFCEFVREGTQTLESPKLKTTTEMLGVKSTKETSVVHTIRDFYYKACSATPSLYKFIIGSVLCHVTMIYSLVLFYSLYKFIIGSVLSQVKTII